MHRLNATLILTLLLLGLTGVAEAQSNPQQLADQNRAAMDAYNNLDIEAAKKTLEEAARNAEKNGIKGPALARTYANLGVVYVGGLSDNAAGLDAFVKALKEDPNVEPDPLVSTPEVAQVFALAKRKAGGGGGAPSRAPVTPPPPAAPVEGNLEHVPAAEQLTQTAVPVYVQTGDLDVSTMKIFYRSLGMPQPKSAEMTKTDDGFTYLIPCTDVFEPSVEYFIIALDDDGTQIGNAGTPQNPVTVAVVTTRTQPAPALPGQVPPSQCSGAEECPPGMPGCGGQGGLGDTCRQDKDCGEGLVCQDNFCAMGEREEDDDDDATDAPRFFFDFTGGLGAAYVGANMAADDAPPLKVADAAKVRAMLPDGSIDPAVATKYVKDRGWDCKVTPSANGGLVLKNCTVAVEQPGFVPSAIANLTFGGYVTPHFALALNVRYAFGDGVGSWGHVTLAPRGEYLVTKPAATGVHAGLLFGALLGPIQAQPPAKTSGAEGPYVNSAVFGVQLGMRLGYRFTRNFGLVALPSANLMMVGGSGQVLFDIDVAGGVSIAF